MGKSVLTSKQAEKLRSLLNGDSIPGTSLPQWLTDRLSEEGLLSVRVHGSRRSISVTDSVSCEKFIKDCFTNGLSLDEWIDLDSASLSRSLLVRKTGDSKTMKVNPFMGFMVNSPVPMNVYLEGSGQILGGKDGLAYMILSPETFDIPDDTVVVGVENVENFMRLNETDRLFGGMRCIYVSRYPLSSALYKWLERIPNRYIHFGDFDLAGISIYQTEFYSRLGERASMLIPSDIESRIAGGNSGLFDRQYQKFSSLRVLDKMLQPLYDMIMKYHRCYEQEGYLY